MFTMEDQKTKKRRQKGIEDKVEPPKVCPSPCSSIKPYCQTMLPPPNNSSKYNSMNRSILSTSQIPLMQASPKTHSGIQDSSE